MITPIGRAEDLPRRPSQLILIAARFQREARVLASLNHPNIAQMHGIEEAEGTRAVPMRTTGGPWSSRRIPGSIALVPTSGRAMLRFNLRFGNPLELAGSDTSVRPRYL